jgi:hypothetical protein
MKNLGTVLLIWMTSVFWSACGSPERDPADTDLRGEWSAEFRTQPGDIAVSGMLVLDTARVDDALCEPGRTDCSRSVAHGRHGISFEALVGHDLRRDVVAGADEGDQIVFVFGACCDQGEISARGELKNGAIRGRWAETFLGGGREGTFTIRRSE